MNSELENLKQQAQELLARITTLEAAEKEMDWPKAGDEYFYVTARRATIESVWADNPANKDHLAFGNVFRTKAEAEKEAEARKVIAELRRCEGGRKFLVEERNYCIFVNLTHCVAGVDCWTLEPNGFGQAYFETYEQAEAAIKTVGADRIVAAAKWLAMGE